MKIETLKNNKKKWFIGSLVVIAIFATLILNTSKAKYRTEQRIPLVRGTFSYKLGDFNVIYILKKDENGKYDTVDTIPDGYELNKEMSYCKRDGEKLDVTMDYNSETKTFSVSPVTAKSTKCYMYFDEITAKDQILAGKTISERTDFSQVLTTDTTGTMYKADDNDGTSYYFAGSTDENWVKFAGFYWRIVRINGDGTIRLIYNGVGTATTGTGTQINTSAFNVTDNDNMYVGYMYESGKVQGLTNSSTIKGVLEPWYDTNIVKKDFDKYVDVNAGFCGDRTAYTDRVGTTPGGGTGTTPTYYGAYIRLYKGGGVSAVAPNLKCNIGNSSPDLYTKQGANKGNASLEQPVGLITADEVAYAGGVVGRENSSYYLYTNSVYWNMSPYSFNTIPAIAYIFIVDGNGDLFGNTVAQNYGIRPVINLKANTQFTGTGLSTDPFVVKGVE